MQRFNSYLYLGFYILTIYNVGLGKFVSSDKTIFLHEKQKCDNFIIF